ncbi:MULTISPECIES: DUF6069 family protein [Actinoalloteichus]|uniref:Uncharacterized protein n=1 Tax=Actinoalloteichus fjordicus TaxID=1612552 RepID=A0AAC9PRV9_9PSEU|nr:MULTISPECIES: DUF6069 family protein [Actinoalloteichus]APU14420.1 hypothetical protein UA74_11800 [Actinoalloteichus fjordicus]APU20389.1 hypothetical protein UA75_11885 [Actinoalloteichus sp. GBA129-24]
MSVGTSPSPLADREQLALSRLPFALLVAALLAALANSLLRFGAMLVIDVDAGLLPLRLLPPIVVSVLSAVGAALVLAALHRWNSRPVHTFKAVSVAFFVVSFAPLVVIGLAAEPPAGFAGIDVSTLLVLGLMHVVALATIVPTLLRLTRQPTTAEPGAADQAAQSPANDVADATTEAGSPEPAAEASEPEPAQPRTEEPTPARD